MIQRAVVTLLSFSLAVGLTQDSDSRPLVTDPCAVVRCPAGRRCVAHFSKPTCDFPPCKPKLIAKCITDPCQKMQCPHGKVCNVVPVKCSTPPCGFGLAAECSVPRPTCPKIGVDDVGICVELCGIDADCPEGQSCCFNGCGRTCFSPGRSTNPCALILCLTGHICVPSLIKLTPCGSPSCAELSATCVKDPCKGFVCTYGERCEAVPVVCVKAPCDFEPVPTCVPIKIPAPERRAVAAPALIKPCKDAKCKGQEMCVLQKVICITAPCPPLAKCIPNVCKLQKKKCEKGQVCVPQHVVCINPPCDPVPVCVKNPCNNFKCPKGKCVPVPVECPTSEAPCVFNPVPTCLN